MTWLVALVLWAPPAAALKPYDDGVARLTAQLKDADQYKRCDALYALGKLMRSDAADDELADKLKAIAEDVGHRDPVNDVRYCAGSLSSDVRYWRQFDSPDAKARKEAERRAGDREELLIMAFPIGLMLVLLVGGLMVVSTQVAAAYLVVHGDRLLEGGARSTVVLFLKHPLFFLIPALDTALFSALAAMSYWRVLNDPKIFALGSGAELHARVVAVVYQPTSLLAVLAAFCLSMFANAAYVSAQVRTGRGEDAGLATGVRDAFGSARDILGLSAAIGAALIGVDWMMRQSEKFLSVPRQVAARFVVAAAESAAMLGLNIAFCAMVFEKKNAVDAAARAADVIKPQWRSGLRAVAATALLRGDVFITPIFCCGMCTYPMWILVSMSDRHTNWLLSGGLEFIGVACVGLGAVFASFILSMVWLLDASFAAALYLHASGDKALPLNLAREIGERPLEKSAR